MSVLSSCFSFNRLKKKGQWLSLVPSPFYKHSEVVIVIKSTAGRVNSENVWAPLVCFFSSLVNTRLRLDTAF